jgi:hypothetical protein
MSDEIYINIGSTIQQPYQGQTPASAQSNETKQVVKRTPASSQTSYRSPSQTPSTYRSPVSGQQPLTNVAKQSPFTYQAQSQSPFTYQVTYQHPAIYSYRQPSSTQSPYIASAQTNIENVNLQSPFTTPISNVNARQPVIYQYRSPFPYSYQQPLRQPVSARNPFTYQNVGPVSRQMFSVARSPYIYWYQIQQAKVVDPEFVDFYQGPQGDGYDVAGNKQAYSEARSPYISQGYLQPARTPVAGGAATGFYQLPYIYLGENVRLNIPYPYIAPATQQPYTIYRSSNPVNAQQPYTFQNPFSTPIAAAQGQQPNERNKQSPFTYQYQQPVRQPVIYQHRQPFTYDNRQPVNNQTPIANVSSQTPATKIVDAQESNPYIANARQPIIYQTRSPFTYRNPVNAQTSTQNVARQPNIYQTPYQVNYQHRSPYIYQTPYTTTRSIGPVAKVKGVYLNDGGTVRKVQEIYTNENSTPEKIHQTVPAARFSKNPSNTQV